MRREFRRAVRETGEMLRSRSGKVPDTRQTSLPPPPPVAPASFSTRYSLYLFHLRSFFCAISLVLSACLQTRVNSAEYMTSSRNLASRRRRKDDDRETTNWSLFPCCLLYRSIQKLPLLLSFSHVSRVSSTRIDRGENEDSDAEKQGERGSCKELQNYPFACVSPNGVRKILGDTMYLI